eukprot:COSAG02_NODE_6580_length_3481_cov_249.557658_1_plen_89_part_00
MCKLLCSLAYSCYFTASELLPTTMLTTFPLSTPCQSCGVQTQLVNQDSVANYPVLPSPTYYFLFAGWVGWIAKEIFARLTRAAPARVP